MQSYAGYFENGSFHSKGEIIKLPERKETIINVLDEPAKDLKIVSKKTNQERKEAWERIQKLCNKVSPDINAKNELEQARDEKYGRIN
jgi:hypothetical protein